MNYEKKYKEALEKARQFSEHPLQEDSSSIVKYIFPELQESEDEKIRKWLIDWAKAVNWSEQFTVTKEHVLAWLEKQGEQKSILNVPLREVILSIWDLGNEWKELTNGSISTEYGTQLDYIQKHWTESEYYLREKQGEQTINQPDFEIPFGSKDSELIEESYYIPKGFHAEIIKDRVTIKKGEQKPAWSAEDTFKVQRICKYLCEAKKYYADITEVRDCIEWLKSLKQRIGG